MATGHCYVPKDLTNWEYLEVEDINDLMDRIRDAEGIKRIPANWKLWINYNDGRGMIEVNRSAASRNKKKEAK